MNRTDMSEGTTIPLVDQSATPNDISTSLIEYDGMIEAALENTLGRAATSSEISGWETPLEESKISVSDITNALAYSDEAKELISGAYVSYTAREPTISEISNAQSSLASGTGIIQISQNIQLSLEATTLASDQVLVGDLYETKLGRMAGSGEIDPWAKLLAGGVATYQHLISDFAQSPEASQKITTIYEGSYGRTPTNDELIRSVGELTSGTTIQDLNVSVTTAAAAAFESADHYIKDIYAADLDRPPTQSELDSWAGTLVSGANTKSDISLSLASSSELKLLIDNTYISVFGRNATTNECQIAQNDLASGMSIDQIKSTIDNSDAAIRFATARTAVSALYNSDFNRVATQSEIDQWANLIAGNVASLDHLKDVFSSSAESAADIETIYHSALGRGTAGSELSSAEADIRNGLSLTTFSTQIQNSTEALTFMKERSFVSGLYRNELGRSGSQAEIDPWARLLAGGVATPLHLQSAFASSAEASAAITNIYNAALGQLPTQHELSVLQDSLSKGISIDTLRSELYYNSQVIAAGVKSTSPLTIETVDEQGADRASPVIQISGRAAPSSTLIIYTNQPDRPGTIIGLARSDSAGNWSLVHSGVLDMAATSISVTEQISGGLGESASVQYKAVIAEAPPIPPGLVVEASYFGVTPNTGADETQLIQKALDALLPGQTLHFQAGKYETNAPLVIGSNNTIEGYGATLNAGPAWVDGAANDTDNMMLTNRNQIVNGQADHDISILGLSFDYGSYNFGGTHAIRFEGVDGVRIDGSKFNGGNDGTALLSCKDTIVVNCDAENTNNAAFDSWSGSGYATVENCVANVSGGYGILFDAVGTYGANYAAANVTAIGNSLNANSGSSTECAIWVAPLGSNSSLSNAVVESNKIDGFSSGVGVDGNTFGAVIADNTIQSGFGPAVFIRNAEGGTPDYGLVEGNTFLNNNIGGNPAEVQIAGSNYQILNNYSDSSGAAAFGWVSGVNDDSAGNIVVGSGRFLYNTSGSSNFNSTSDVAVVDPISTWQPAQISFIQSVDLQSAVDATIAPGSSGLALGSSDASSSQVVSTLSQVAGSLINGLRSGDSLDIVDMGFSGTSLAYRTIESKTVLLAQNSDQSVAFAVDTSGSSKVLIPQVFDDGNGGLLLKF